MKRILAAAIALLALTCCAPSNAQEDFGSSQTDPIYNENATFNDITAPAQSQSAYIEDATESADAAKEQSVADGYKRYQSALSLTESLSSYRISAAGSVTVEIEGISVELKKSSEKYAKALNGDFCEESQTDLKDEHNSSVWQMLKASYGDKQAGKLHTRTEYLNFINSSEDYLDIKTSVYRSTPLSEIMGEAYSLKASEAGSLTLTETDAAVTVKFMLNSKGAAELISAELLSAGVQNINANEVEAEHCILTAVIASDGTLSSCTVSARASVAGKAYTVSRSLLLTDKNSAAFVCVKPEWV